MNTQNPTMDQQTLDRLHAHHLQALLEADRICRKHGIRYFIVAGTLLGAVRHKGFIPWDDDLDIALMRSEYERFLQVAAKELDQRFFLQTNETDSEYFLCYAKIRVNGTRLVEATAADANIHHGVYIDVFPLDSVPDGRVARLLHRWGTYLLIRLALARSKFRLTRSGRLRRVLHRASKVLLRPVPLSLLLRKTDRAMSRYSGKNTEYVVNLGGAYGYRRETLRRAYFDDVAELPFEVHDVMAPAHWHELLSDYYGDYQTPPPEDQRYNRHSVLELEL